MPYKQREVETVMVYGATMDEAHAKLAAYCKDKHVLDTKMGTAPDGRACFCVIIEKRIDNRRPLNEG